MFMKFLAASPLVFLMSCASLNEEACRSGDWATIGYNDGTRGRAESYITEHREACGEFGITPKRPSGCGRGSKVLSNIAPKTTRIPLVATDVS